MCQWKMSITSLKSSNPSTPSQGSHLGLAIFVGLILLLRKSPTSWLPWLGVLGFELFNEVMDIFHWHMGAFSFELGDSLKDIANTMVWPTIALICFRLDDARKRRATLRSTSAPTEAAVR